jgi:hypothetical protein
MIAQTASDTTIAVPWVDAVLAMSSIVTLSAKMMAFQTTGLNRDGASHDVRISTSTMTSLIASARDASRNRNTPKMATHPVNPIDDHTFKVCCLDILEDQIPARNNGADESADINCQTLREKPKLRIN